MERLKQSTLYKIWLRFMRVLQFLSAAISLGIFSARVYKVLRLYKRINSASGAVEDILAAAVAYTILATILQLCLKGKGPKFLRWLLIVLDIAFVGAFIAVASLTRPHGPSGPCKRSVLHNVPASNAVQVRKLQFTMGDVHTCNRQHVRSLAPGLLLHIPIIAPQNSSCYHSGLS